jgi:hypothetical protein
MGYSDKIVCVGEFFGFELLVLKTGKERKKEAAKIYDDKNKEKKKKYAEARKEEIKEYNKLYRINNKEKISDVQKELEFRRI